MGRSFAFRAMFFGRRAAWLQSAATPPPRPPYSDTRTAPQLHALSPHGPRAARPPDRCGRHAIQASRHRQGGSVSRRSRDESTRRGNPAPHNERRATPSPAWRRLPRDRSSSSSSPPSPPPPRAARSLSSTPNRGKQASPGSFPLKAHDPSTFQPVPPRHRHSAPLAAAPRSRHLAPPPQPVHRGVPQRQRRRGRCRRRRRRRYCGRYMRNPRTRRGQGPLVPNSAQLELFCPPYNPT